MLGKVEGFFHGGITVRDMDESLAFYLDALGLEVYFDRVLDGNFLREALNLKFKEMRVVYLSIPGGGFVELLEYRDIERFSASSRPCDFGGGHFCLYVSDIDDFATRLFKLGYRARSKSPVTITQGPNLGARILYSLDPDGYAVELFQRPLTPSS